MSPSTQLQVRNVLLAANRRHTAVADLVPQFLAAARRRGLTVSEWDGSAEPLDLHGLDVIVALGGDGYLMGLIRSLDYPEIPIFGVNYGRVGFLMNPVFSADALAECLAHGLFLPLPYPVLRIRVRREDGSEETTYAFNDFVLERASGQTVHLQVYIGGTLLNRYSGDGLIVATPGGSTAYSLAAGGPVVHTEVPCIIVTPLNPHRPVQFHSLQFSVLLPLRTKVHVIADYRDKRPVRCSADGREICASVDEVFLDDSGRRVTLLRNPDYRFIDTVLRKIIGKRDENGEEISE
ncbi:MAG: NAD(+)/NADH kinase [Planctomycetota bacterium]